MEVISATWQQTRQATKQAVFFLVLEQNLTRVVASQPRGNSKVCIFSTQYDFFSISCSSSPSHKNST